MLSVNNCVLPKNFERLSGIIKSAGDIAMVLNNETNRLMCVTQYTHLRPTKDGISFVSTNQNTPQKRAKCIDFSLPIRIANRCYQEPNLPKRKTPEKELQSWLILDAYQHNMRMEAVEELVRQKLGCSQEIAVFFVTDEIPLYKDETDKKVVCDILAVRREKKADGSYQWIPMHIELKSERDLTRLIEQMQYGELFDNLNNLFEELYSQLLGPFVGEKIIFSQAPEKWIAWPNFQNRENKSTRDKLEKNNVMEIKFEKNSTVNSETFFSFH